MKIDWVAKLQHLLHTIAFCLAIAALFYVFQPERPYAPPVAYSLSIGLITWAVIDMGRHLLPSSRETGWPTGPAGVLIVVVGIIGGFFFGNALGDVLCRAFHLYGDYPPPADLSRETRNSLLVTVIAGVIGSWYFYSRSKGAYLERQMAEARRQQNEARLKLLETQLEPHMLFNTLANLRALIGADPQRAQVMLDHMIAYLRATLGASRAASHTLQDEFQRLHDYLALMAIRMGPRLAYELQLPPELAAQPVPTLLLQPLVENSIKHGLEPKLEGGRITVSARREGGDVVLEVADTGVGLQDAPAAGSNGFGLAQVRERLQTQFGDRAALDFVAAHAGGVRATTRFPSEP